MKSTKLTKKLSCQLHTLQNQLQKLTRFDEFSLFDPRSASIDNFDLFTSVIEDKAKIYDHLSFLLQKAKRCSESVAFDSEKEFGKILQDVDFFHNQGLQLSENRSLIHLTTLEKIQFKMKQIFGLVEEYLDQLDADFHQEHFQLLLDSNLDRLRAVIESKETGSEKIKEVEEEFEKIKKVLKEKLTFEKDRLLRRVELDKADQRIRRQEAVETRDKAVMVIEPEKTDIEKQKIEKIEIERIKVKLDVSEVACIISAEKTGFNAYICFSGENSYLSALNSSGLSVIKDKRSIYKKKFTDDLKNLGDVVYCKGAYYIYNHSPGRILRKGEDFSDPNVWWDKKDIQKFWASNKKIRVNREQTALIVNLNDTEMIVIEVRDDGTAGRELVIVNETGSRIDCHEPLKNSRILTINKIGLVMVFQADYKEFSNWSQRTSTQIQLMSDRKENQFWLAVCEKSQLCAVQISVSGKASRILIHKIVKGAGKDKFTFLTQLDVFSQNLQRLSNGCFSPYFGDNVILCAQSQSNKTAFAYGYDVHNNTLTQIYSKVFDKGDYCWKLSRVGDRVCGILTNGGFIIQFKFFLGIPI